MPASGASLYGDFRVLRNTAPEGGRHWLCLGLLDEVHSLESMAALVPT